MESRIQRIASYFQLNCKENIDLEALCRKNGLSNGPSSVTGNSISIFLQAAIFWTCVYATPRVSCEKHENGSAKSPNP